MLNSLDLLVIAGVVLAAGALISVAGMFFIKNMKFKNICIFAASALGLYLSSVGMYIHEGMFFGRMVVCGMFGLAGIAALLFWFLGREHASRYRLAQVMASVACVGGFFSAFL